MTRAIVYDLSLLLPLASSAQGVTNLQAQALFTLDTQGAWSVLRRAEVRNGWVKASAPGTDLHYFTTEALRTAWLEDQARQRAAAQAAAVQLRQDRQRERLLRNQQVAKQKAAARSAVRLAAGVSEAQRKRHPLAADREKQKAKPVPGVPPALQPGAPVVTSDTKFTKPPRMVDIRRVDLMADPLPGVPGWGRQVFRPGAFDFRQYQHRTEQEAS